MRMKPKGRSHSLFTGFTCALAFGLFGLWGVQGHATEALCQKKAESLGWTVGCGCLKYDLSTIQDSLALLLPDCRLEDSEALAKDVANGQKESVDNDEYNFLCLLSCNSTNWTSVNKLIGRSAGKGI